MTSPISPMAQYLYSLLEKSEHKTEDGRPFIACQVTLRAGVVQPGSLMRTEMPSIVMMLVEGQDQRGVRKVVDRVFAIDDILLVDFPRDLPIISRGGSQIITPA